MTDHDELIRRARDSDSLYDEVVQTTELHNLISDLADVLEAASRNERRLREAIEQADADHGCECSDAHVRRAGHRTTCWKFDLLAASSKDSSTSP